MEYSAILPNKELWKKRKKTIIKISIFIFLLGFVLIWLLPVFGALLTAFRSMDDLTINGFWSIPESLSIDAFIEAWTRGKLGKYIFNSFIITIPALAGVLFLSSLCGYALSRYRFRSNFLIYMIFVGGMMLPFQMLMLPVFKLSNILKIYDTYIGIIIFHMAFQLGFCTFFMRNFMMTVPDQLAEAARIDGCNEFGIFFRIYLPLSLPAVAAIGTLEFTWIFNDYLWALVLLKSNDMKPVTTGLATLKGEYFTAWNILVAGSLLAAIPTLVVFIFLQRYFISGLTMGSDR